MNLRQLAKTAFSAVDIVRGPFPGPRILIYHQIGAGHGAELEVTPEAFRCHLDWLGENGSVVSLESAIATLGSPGAESVFVLTFDDGYLDMYENGFVLLRERSIPFTLFLTTEPVETGRPLAPQRRSTPLTWGHVDEMVESGLMTLGGHTHTHPDLRRLSPGAIEDDLGRSDDLIEQRCGQRPRHFAYPWGYWSASADAAVRARYTTASLGGGAPNLGTTDLFLLHRIPIQLNDGVLFFRRKARRGLRTEEQVRRIVSRYDGP